MSKKVQLEQNCLKYQKLKTLLRNTQLTYISL